jgi:hypothetical protein
MATWICSRLSQTDVNNAGLVNPYLFISYNFNAKLSLRSDFHAFMSENNFVKDGATLERYLGFENDWLLNYTLNDATKLEWGVCVSVANRRTYSY